MWRGYAFQTDRQKFFGGFETSGVWMHSTPTLTLPLSGGGNRAPSPGQGEGWDGGRTYALSTRFMLIKKLLLTCLMHKRPVSLAAANATSPYGHGSTPFLAVLPPACRTGRSARPGA